jgi:putative transposase
VPGQTWSGAAASFVGMWVVMMVAMMVPSFVPMLWRYRQAVFRTKETRVDNGTEFTSKALDQWAYENKVTLHFITPGRPMENGYIESFHGKFREECLNEHWFLTLDDARETIESWRLDYNQVRPHSSLGYLTPEEFATGYANVESKLRFPHSHSLDGCAN